MHLVPNRSVGGLHAADGTTVAVSPQPYIDTPYMSYVRWLQECDRSADGLIAGRMDPEKRIAVVGAGAAGIVAAYELLKLGANVTVFEASGRHGGRCFSKPLLTDATGNTYIAELGAMRFPPSEETLFYYIEKLQNAGVDITVDDTFPDPGKVETTLSYLGKAETWLGADTPPAGFETVFNGWISFCNDGFDNGTLKLAAPAAILKWLQSGTTDDVKNAVSAWTTYIKTFSNLSFYDGLRRIFLDAKAPGGTPWRFPDDFERFGALGIGSGGFGPLYGVDFLDIIRLPVNGLETNQALVVTGISSVTDGLATAAIPVSGKTTSVHQVTRYNAAVVGVARSGDGSQVELTVQDTSKVDGPTQTLSFDRVIVAATHRSMEITLGLGGGNTGAHPVLSTPAADAIRRLACMSSSKTFVLTNEQFWTGKSPVGTQDIVSDTLVRGMYALDYNVNKQNPSPPGVVLLSYVWGPDAIKQGAYGTVTTDQDILAPLPQAALFNLSQRRALLGGDIVSIMHAANFEAFNAGNLSPYQGDLLNAVAIDWQSEPYYFGAFKLNDPGQNYLVQVLYYDFLKAKGGDAGNPDTYLYLAGDSTSFTGGWVEGAMQTGLNAAAAVVVSLGGTLTGNDTNPFACLSAGTYTYEASYPLAGAARSA